MATESQLPTSVIFSRTTTPLHVCTIDEIVKDEDIRNNYPIEEELQTSEENNEIVATLRFWNIKYTSTFRDFITQMYAEIDNCNYLDKERMLRDKILCSTSGELQKQLIKENALNFDRAVEICEFFEAMQLEKAHAIGPKKESVRQTTIAFKEKQNIKSISFQKKRLKNNYIANLEMQKDETVEMHTSDLLDIKNSETSDSCVNDNISDSEARFVNLDFPLDAKDDIATNENSPLLSIDNPSQPSIHNPSSVIKEENIAKMSRKDPRNDRTPIKVERSLKRNNNHTSHKIRVSLPKTVDKKTELFFSRKLLKPPGFLDIKLDEPDMLEERDLYIECQECRKQFKSKTEYNAHYGEHFGLKAKSCPFCDRKYYNARRLNRHLAERHDICSTWSGEVHVCDECGKTYSSKGDLKKHKQGIHRGEKPFQCKICSKFFSQAANLKVHMDYHNDIKKFICHVCGKGFRNRMKLNEHHVSHTDERPYQCDICEKTFKFCGNLRTHKLAKHSLIRPFICEKCGKGYVEMRYFRKHKLRCYINVKSDP